MCFICFFGWFFWDGFFHANSALRPMFVFKDQLKSLARPFGELMVESTADLEQVFPAKIVV